MSSEELDPEAVTITVWLQGCAARVCLIMPAERDRLLNDWQTWGGGSPRVYDLVTGRDAPAHWMIDLSAIMAIEH